VLAADAGDIDGKSASRPVGGIVINCRCSAESKARRDRLSVTAAASVRTKAGNRHVTVSILLSSSSSSSSSLSSSSSSSLCSSINPLTGTGNYSATSNNMKSVH